MKIKQLSLKLWPLLLLGAGSFAPLYSMELPQVKEGLLQSLQRNRTPLLIGAGSLLAAGAAGAAYWYFRKPSNENIKEAIRRKTAPLIIGHANNAKAGIDVKVYLGIPPARFKSYNDYYIDINTIYKGTQTPEGLSVVYYFACDKSREPSIIPF